MHAHEDYQLALGAVVAALATIVAALAPFSTFMVTIVAILVLVTPLFFLMVMVIVVTTTSAASMLATTARPIAHLLDTPVLVVNTAAVVIVARAEAHTRLGMAEPEVVAPVLAVSDNQLGVEIVAPEVRLEEDGARDRAQGILHRHRLAVLEQGPHLGDIDENPRGASPTWCGVAGAVVAMVYMASLR